MYTKSQHFYVKAWRENKLESKLNELFSSHTYFQIGGPIQEVLYPENLQDLKTISNRILSHEIKKYFILGKGSNLLVSDHGYDGVVIKTSKLQKSIQRLENGLLEVGASVENSVLLGYASRNGLQGVEYLSGIPGSVGGAVWMNAGTTLGETKDVVMEVRVFDLETGKLKIFSGDDLQYEYRRNLFLKPSMVVLSALFWVEEARPEEIQKKIKDYLEQRKKNQPLDRPSCGSVFKNPVGTSSWKVIDQLGLRGHRVGDAQFSEKHCNFILNLKNAKASEVRELIELAKKRALEDLGVCLEEEVIFLSS